MYPYTAWEDSYIHNAFENAGATLSGVETAYQCVEKERKAAGGRRPLSLLPSVETAAHTILASSPCPVPWSEDTTWCMSAMTMVLT